MALLASAGPLISSYDLAMLDLDGVVYRGESAVPHAVESISNLGSTRVRLAFLTNNASRTAAEVAGQLRGFGLDVAEADVVTAGEAIASMVAESVPPGSAVLVVGGPGLIVPLEGRGLRCVCSADESPVAVVQGFHPDVGWQNLAEASYAIQAGVTWFVSNPDQTFPTARGVAPGNGSLVEAVRRATGAEPAAVAGKPERGLFEEARRRTGATRPLMVGDRIDTDIVGALNCGIDAMHVLTGISGIDEVVQLPPEQRPHYVAPDLRSLLQEHPQVAVEGSRAMCGSAIAQVGSDGEVTLTAGEPGSVEAIRAVVAAAWMHLDETGDVPRLVGPALEH
ncbi:MAG TPA: HAD-IIA family hydrolase [Aeromicrobium sp.]|nr:HAD-IIA family hydrolase [Aeromicrobium sp.]HKY56689.1 HAD-IIA family hydrolase [Aeromicrobium sp.]